MNFLLKSLFLFIITFNYSFSHPNKEEKDGVIEMKNKNKFPKEQYPRRLTFPHSATASQTLEGLNDVRTYLRTTSTSHPYYSKILDSYVFSILNMLEKLYTEKQKYGVDANINLQDFEIEMQTYGLSVSQEKDLNKAFLRLRSKDMN